MRPILAVSTCLIIAVVAVAPRPAAGKASDQLSSLGRDVRAAFRNSGGSYQKLIRRLTSLARSALEGHEWSSASRSLRAQGFRVQDESQGDDGSFYSITLPGIEFRPHYGPKHTFKIQVCTQPQTFLAKPTVFDISLITTELEAAPNMPLHRFASHNPYPKGTVLEHFLRIPELKKEAADNQTLKRLTIRYNAPRPPSTRAYAGATGVIYYVSSPSAYAYNSSAAYYPATFEVEASLESRTQTQTHSHEITFRAESLLDRWGSLVNRQVRPGKFIPKDGFRDDDSGLYKRFEKSASWSGSDAGGVLRRKYVPAAPAIDRPKDLKVALGAGDLKTLPADIRSLKVAGPGIRNADLTLIGPFHNLRYLELSADTSFGPGVPGNGWQESGLSFLPTLQTLERLQIDAGVVTDKTMSAVARLQRLRRLELTKTHVTASGIQLLAYLPGLERLSITSSALDNRAFQAIAALHNLKRLEITPEGDFQDAALAPLAALSNLESLAISGSKNVTPDGFRFLADLPRLNDLSLGDMRLDDRILNLLARLTGLRKLSLTSISGLTNLRLTKLKGLKMIESLGIQYCPVVTRADLLRLKKNLSGDFVLD